MRYRILDKDDDYSFGKGQQNFTFGTYAVSQAIKTRLLLLKGEWWENLKEGLPLFQDILGTSGSDENIYIVDSLIKERIIKTPGVLEIKNFESRLEKRQYFFFCTIISKYGSIEISQNM